MLRWLSASPALSAPRETPPAAGVSRSGRIRPPGRPKTSPRQPEFTARPGRQA
jgi:hypothetical protein